jgi:hypothetical protein
LVATSRLGSGCRNGTSSGLENRAKNTLIFRLPHRIFRRRNRPREVILQAGLDQLVEPTANAHRFVMLNPSTHRQRQTSIEDKHNFL